MRETKANSPEQEEWEDPYPRKKGSWSWLWTILAIITLYIFSIGPAAYLERKGFISKRTMQTIYTPLVNVAKVSDITLGLLSAYANLWVSK